ncbi:scamp-domain-containing protein [Histomonas meleagridis]|uniref:scamp-domain-containing protein n=1 Tax=Histomonas meleagridis TaxID=135588 RepID=UPI00355A8408|nr:scamp-domain-containing protein [Histomonas meleagridis]KAH0802089.1 scamp-domain-containing protein [Histomonas meleagridis]
MSDNPFQEEVGDDELQFAETPSPTQKPTAGYSQAKMSKLEQLRAREAELLKRQEEINSLKEDIIPSPNFPSFYPLIIYNLDRDIPQAAQKVIKNSLLGLCFAAGMAIFNVLAVLSVSGLDKYPHIRCFIFALIQGFATVYFLYTQSYSKIYADCRKHDVSFRWTIVQFIFVIWCVYLTVGFPTSGSVGLATLLDLIAKSKNGFSIFMALVNTGAISAMTYFQFVTLFQAQKYQKISGNDKGLEERLNDLKNEL